MDLHPTSTGLHLIATMCGGESPYKSEQQQQQLIEQGLIPNPLYHSQHPAGILVHPAQPSQQQQAQAQSTLVEFSAHPLVQNCAGASMARPLAPVSQAGLAIAYAPLSNGGLPSQQQQQQQQQQQHQQQQLITIAAPHTWNCRAGCVHPNDSSNCCSATEAIGNASGSASPPSVHVAAGAGHTIDGSSNPLPADPLPPPAGLAPRFEHPFKDEPLQLTGNAVTPSENGALSRIQSSGSGGGGDGGRESGKVVDAGEVNGRLSQDLLSEAADCRMNTGVASVTIAHEANGSTNGLTTTTISNRSTVKRGASAAWDDEELDRVDGQKRAMAKDGTDRLLYEQTIPTEESASATATTTTSTTTAAAAVREDQGCLVPPHPKRRGRRRKSEIAAEQARNLAVREAMLAAAGIKDGVVGASAVEEVRRAGRDKKPYDPWANRKASGRPFVQDGPCFALLDVTSKKFPKCSSCRVNDEVTECRFSEFRKLRFVGELVQVDGFTDSDDAKESDRRIWMTADLRSNSAADETLSSGDAVSVNEAASSNAEQHEQKQQQQEQGVADQNPLQKAAVNRLDEKTAVMVLTNVGDIMCDLVREEAKAKNDFRHWMPTEPGAEGGNEAKIKWRRVYGVREMCDVCSTTIFNLHWTCSQCGFVACIDCFRARALRALNEVQPLALPASRQRLDAPPPMLCGPASTGTAGTALAAVPPAGYSHNAAVVTATPPTAVITTTTPAGVLATLTTATTAATSTTTTTTTATAAAVMTTAGTAAMTIATTETTVTAAAAETTTATAATTTTAAATTTTPLQSSLTSAVQTSFNNNSDNDGALVAGPATTTTVALAGSGTAASTSNGRDYRRGTKESHQLFPDKDEFRWLYCGNPKMARSHSPRKLLMTQIVPGNILERVNQQQHEVRRKRGIPMRCGCDRAANGVAPQTQGSTDGPLVIPAGLTNAVVSTSGTNVTNTNSSSSALEQIRKLNPAEELAAKAALRALTRSRLKKLMAPASNSSFLRALLANEVERAAGLLPGGDSTSASALTAVGAPPSLLPGSRPRLGPKGDLADLRVLADCATQRSTITPGIKAEPNDALEGADAALTDDKPYSRIHRIASAVLEARLHPERRRPLCRLPVSTNRLESLAPRVGQKSEGRRMYAAPHEWLCCGKLLLLLEATHPQNLELFQEQWNRGQPVVVAHVSKVLDMDLWRPDAFLRDFGEQKSTLVDCKTGADLGKPIPMKRFWEGFECFAKRMCDKNGDHMLLKLKDWPPDENFSEVLPERYADLMRALPLPMYTLREGSLNLANRLPDCFVPPDLGPKMYNAYGSALFPTKGTTNLHLDMSDAANVMVYVGIPRDGNCQRHIEEALRAVEEAGCDATQMKRVREKGAKVGAVWHIFHAQDAEKIRELLKQVMVERGQRLEANSDPIHDQLWYLDSELRRRLLLEKGVQGYAIAQCVGDAVFIPAGAPHQVRNLHSCIKVAEDFVSPENLAHCLRLTNEFRFLSDTHTNHEDKLQIKNVVYHAVKDAVSVLDEGDRPRMEDCKKTPSCV